MPRGEHEPAGDFALLLTTPLAVAGILALAACQTRPAPPDVPAVITNPTPKSRAELLRVLRGALNGAPVTIAEDALTRDGTLIVEPARPGDGQGLPLNGREIGRPEHFGLVKNGSRCVLVCDGTGQRWTLASTICSPK